MFKLELLLFCLGEGVQLGGLSACSISGVKFTKSRDQGSATPGHGQPKVSGDIGQAVQVIVVAL